MAMSDIAAVILAAGRSTRFAGDRPNTTKLTAELNGKPMVRHVAESALASTARPAIVVTGHARDLVQEALAGLPLTFAHNADYATGLASTLRTGIAHVPAKASGAVILLGDMPLVSAALIDCLIKALEKAKSADAIVPIANGRRGNPVLLSRSLFPAVARLAGDEGARGALQDPGIHVLEIAVEGEAASADIDTAEALELWRQKQAGGATSGPATR
jgi:molybdenum cofactor cytidylyltransferase